MKQIFRTFFLSLLGFVPFAIALADSVKLENPLVATSFCGILTTALNVAIQFLGPVFVLVLIYVGFLFVQARGRPEELKKAKSAFFNTCIGILLVLGAYGLGQIFAYTLSKIQSAAGGAPQGTNQPC